MIIFPTPPVSQALHEAEIQDKLNYGNFIEQTNLSLKQDRFSLLSRNTFDRKTKHELQKKRRIPFLMLALCISSLAAITIALMSEYTSWTGFEFFKNTPQFNFIWIFTITLLGGLCIGIWFYHNHLKHSPDSHSSGGLTEEADDLEKSLIFQDWAQNIIDSKKRLFIQDIATGKIYKFSEVLPNTRNNIMSLLGDEHHRKAWV